MIFTQQDWPAWLFFIVLWFLQFKTVDYEIYFYQRKKIWLAPPPFVFGIAWGILYILMGTATWLVNRQEVSPLFYSTMYLLIVNLVLNKTWPILYFYYHAIQYAFLVLVAIVGTAIAAAILCIFFDTDSGYVAMSFIWAYVVWCLFALYLNFSAIFIKTPSWKKKGDTRTSITMNLQV